VARRGEGADSSPALARSQRHGPTLRSEGFSCQRAQKIQFYPARRLFLAFLLSGLTFPVENIPDVLGGGRGVDACTCSSWRAVHRDAAGWI